MTAAAAITLGLKIPLPFSHQNAPTSQQTLRSVLVIGGGSGVGASAIQLLRIASPSLQIVATASSRHHSKLISLGATACVDRATPDIVEAVRAASASVGGGPGVDAILDAVGGASEENQPCLFDALRADGPRLYSAVFIGSQTSIPAGVEAVTSSGRQTFEVLGGRSAMSALAKLAQDGEFKPPLNIEIVGRGLENIGDGLKKLKTGVSGTKLIVAM